MLIMSTRKFSKCSGWQQLQLNTSKGIFFIVFILTQRRYFSCGGNVSTSKNTSQSLAKRAFGGPNFYSLSRSIVTTGAKLDRKLGRIVDDDTVLARGQYKTDIASTVIHCVRPLLPPSNYNTKTQCLNKLLSLAGSIYVFQPRSCLASKLQKFKPFPGSY